MDSGNGGSIRSSSGDEEYDSQAATTEFVSISDRHPSLSLHHHQLQPTGFDFSPNYLQALSLPNLEAAHEAPDALRYDKIPHSVVSSSSFAHASTNHQVYGDNARASSAPTNLVPNSKKRTRASRRAPTTVLTTDTSNFRAMVQEYTGIPAPPFSGLSYSRRIDLLTGSSSLDPPGIFYPLHTSAQKIQQYPYATPHCSSFTLPCQNSVDPIPSPTNTSSIAGTSSNPNPSAPKNYNLLPHDHLGQLNSQPQHIMLNLRNHPILTFHSAPGFHGSCSATLPDNFEGLGMNHGQVNTTLVQSHADTEEIALRSNKAHRNVQGFNEGRGDDSVYHT